MSTNTAAVADAAPPAKGKKKLILIAGAGVLVLVLAAVAAMMLLKKPAQDEEGDAPTTAAATATKRDPKVVPVFVPLEAFTVNLADRDAERYAQVGITLEVTDVKVGDQIKAYMPAIRNNILMAIADRTAADLQGREGKAQLAAKVLRETARALGHEVEAEEAAANEDDPAAQPAKGKKKKKKAASAELPVKAVHFSNFIIQ